jgi:hypothetical protein
MARPRKPEPKEPDPIKADLMKGLGHAKDGEPESSPLFS